MIELGLMRAQALAVGQVREGPGEKLIEMREGTGRILGGVASHAAAKGVQGWMPHELCEH